MNPKYILLALFLLVTPAHANEPFSVFSSESYGGNRKGTEEEEKLFTFVKEKADAPSRYFRLGKSKYLVTVDSAYIISGLYLVSLDEGYAKKIVGGNIGVIEEHRTERNYRWLLVNSGSIHMGVGVDSYTAVIIPSDATQNLVVSPLAGVSTDDNRDGEIVSYKVDERRGDVVFRTREEDIAQNTKKETEVTFIFSQNGFTRKP